MHGNGQGPSVSHGAYRALAILQDRAYSKGFCWPGEKSIAADMGCSERTARRYLKELANAGLVSVQRRGKKLTNIYTPIPRSKGRVIGQNCPISDRTELSSKHTTLRVVSKTKNNKRAPSSLSKAKSLSSDRVVAYEAMKENGVTEKTALTLAAAHDPKLILAQVASLQFRTAKNPPAMLVDSIRQEWDPHPAIAEAEAEAERRVALVARIADRDAQKAAAQAAQDALNAAELAEAAREREEAQRAFDALTDAEKESRTAMARASFGARSLPIPDDIIAERVLRELRVSFGSFAVSGAPI